MNLVFLLEEKSMEEVLRILEHKILPKGWVITYISHHGKNDLKKSIPRKLRGWNVPNTKFVILIDQDRKDCYKLKDELIQLVSNTNHPDAMIRIVCNELESWFLGDLAAVRQAYKVNKNIGQDSKKYREPDKLQNAKEELKSIVPSYQPLSGARSIAPCLNVNQNKSHSFNVFIKGIKNLAEQL